jgi:hypothetical protein
VFTPRRNRLFIVPTGQGVAEHVRDVDLHEVPQVRAPAHLGEEVDQPLVRPGGQEHDPPPVQRLVLRAPHPVLDVEQRLVGGRGEPAAVRCVELGQPDELDGLAVVVEVDLFDDRAERVPVQPRALLGHPGEVVAVAELLGAVRLHRGRDVDVRGRCLADLHVPQHGPGVREVRADVVDILPHQGSGDRTGVRHAACAGGAAQQACA